MSLHLEDWKKCSPGAKRFLVTAPSMVVPNEEFDINVAALRADGYPDPEFRGKVILRSTDGSARIPREFSFGPDDKGVHRFMGLSLCALGVHTIAAEVEGSTLKGTSNPIKCCEERPYNLYWGDIHVHSILGWCQPAIAKSVDFAYWFGQAVSNLDFCAVTDHAYGLNDEKWQLSMAKAREYNRPGDFVTFLGYESSHTTENGGDINVYYLDEGGFRNFLPEGGNLSNLWQWLKDQGNRFMTIPHHTARLGKSRDWALGYYGGPEAEPVFEIYSKWGASEYLGNPRPIFVGASEGPTYYWDALDRGYRLGVIGGSDDHNTSPGSDMTMQIVDFNGKECFYRQSGLAAVYAERLTRETLWKAIMKRRCYGTSIDRIIVDFKIDDRMMGEEIQSSKPVVTAEVYATTRLIKVELVKNNRVVYRHGMGEPQWGSPSRRTEAKEVRLCFTDNDLKGESYYYLRVMQADGEMAWSSPIWVRP